MRIDSSSELKRDEQSEGGKMRWIHPIEGTSAQRFKVIGKDATCGIDWL